LTTLLGAVHFAGRAGPQADLGASILLWARLAY
jgi:hypothetical protein